MNEELKSRALEALGELEPGDEELELVQIARGLLAALEAQEIATDVAVKARREAVDALRRQSHRTSGW